MHLWRASLVILMAVAALPLCETAGAESPPPAAPANGPAVIMALPPPMSGVFGGKVEFAGKAFPIVAESKDIAVQTAISAVKLPLCQVCRGTGKVSKRDLVKPAVGITGNPTWHVWEEDCQTCGGFKDVYDQRFGLRLLLVIERLGHVPRDGKYDEFRKAAEGCLATAVDVRNKTITTQRCKPVIKTETRTDRDIDGYSTYTVHLMTGVTTEPDQQKPFHVETAPLVEPLWARVGPQPPTGQAVIIIGTTSEKTKAADWTWMRMKPSGKGPEAIILCGTTQKNVVPAGKVVFGGLMIGRWTPEGGGAPPAPAGSPAAHTPIPASGPLPPGSLPVVLAVVATEGK